MATDPILTNPRNPPPSNPRNRPPSGNNNNNKPTDPNAQARSDARAAERRAVARENAAKKKAGKRYLEQAANLEAQAKALKVALNKSFAAARDQNLGDISMNLNQQIKLLKEGHGLRAEQFLKTAADTGKATADTAEAGARNAVRERQDSMSALLEQGAGETDMLRTMVMAARNWHNNASEGNRAYFDSLRSVNQGIVDLNIDTKSALTNVSASAEAERERLWQDFYNRRSESFTQLGNIRGQQRDFYAQAKEMGVKPKKGAEAAAKKESEKSFMDAAKEAGKSYKQQALPTWIKDYKGQKEVETRQSNTELAAAMVFEPIKKAEGSTLRKWAA